MKVTRRLVVTLASALTLLSPAMASQQVRPLKIMMILYRGTTDAEKGFMSYFDKHAIPVEFIVRDAQADNQRVSEFVKEARAMRPDLIYTFGTTVTSKVVGTMDESNRDERVTDIPVVFNVVADPLGANITKSLKSSGRNFTGVTHLAPLAAQIQALLAMRKVKSLGVLYNPYERNSTLTVQDLKATAEKNGISVQIGQLTADGQTQPTVEMLRGALQNLLAKQPDFIYLPSDSFLIKHARTVVDMARAARIPVFAATEAPIRNDGALIGLVSNYFSAGELAAHKAEQILLKNAQPAAIPIEPLNRFTYLINMKSAKQLGTYPPVALFKVAEVVNDSADARE